MSKAVDSPIPQTKKVWPLTTGREPLGFQRVQEELRLRLGRAGVPEKLVGPYASIILGPGFLGAASPVGLTSEAADRACGEGQPAELLLRYSNGDGVYKWLPHALQAPEPVCHLLALCVLADHGPMKAVSLGRVQFLGEDEGLDPLIDVISPLLGEKNYDDAFANITDWPLVWGDSSAVLRRLTARGLLHPAAALDLEHYENRRKDLPYRAYDQRWLLEGWNSPRRFEFWFRQLGGALYDLFHEFWLSLDDKTLAILLKEAIQADRRVKTDSEQRETNKNRDQKAHENCATLGDWFADVANRVAIKECLGLIEAGVNYVRVEQEIGQRRGVPVPEALKKLEEAKLALVAAVPRTTSIRDPHPLSQAVNRLWAAEPKAEVITERYHYCGGHNLLVHLDERMQRGDRMQRGVPRELKAAFVHLGHRLLSQTNSLQRNFRAPGFPGFYSVGLSEFDRIVLQRTAIDARGPVEKRLGDAALHALSDLRATTARVVHLGADEELPAAFRSYIEDAARSGMLALAAANARKQVDDAVEWEARQDFLEKWPEVERQLVIAHQCGSLWAMTKQLLLAMRNLKGAPCVGPELRYEIKSTELASAGWKIMAHWLGTCLRTALDLEQGADPELFGLRTSWAEFLLERLLQPKSESRVDKHKPPHEESPIFRVRHLRALKHLRCNPEGKGHRIVHLVAEQDPSPEVVQEAKSVYEIVRRADGHIAPEAARRSLVAAFFLFREAQVRVAGGEVAPRARRTWYNEAQDAKRDYKWFFERGKMQH